MRKSICIVLICLIGSGLTLKAQTYTLNGDAYSLGGDCYGMTVEAKDQIGTIWFNQKLNLSQPFDISFTMNFGNLKTGADGMTFALQSVGLNAMGTLGGSFGWASITPSFAVEFDTYQNTNIGDPVYNHICFDTNGDVSHEDGSNVGTYVSALASQAYIDDSLEHNIRITWNPAYDSIYVYFDCELRKDTTYDIVNKIFGGNPSVWWGFTGGTGKYYNNQSVCYVQNDLVQMRDTTKCSSDTVQFYAPAGTNYAWTPSTGVSNTTIANPLFYPTTTTKYYVNFTDNCGNSRLDSATITVAPLSVNLGNDTNLCSGHSITLNAGSFSSYLWQNGTTAQTLTASASGTYWVKVKSSGGCSASDTVVVTVLSPLSIGVSPTSPAICNGQSVSLTASGGSTYAWSPSTGLSATTGTSVNAGPSGNSTYTVTGTDVNGCTNTASATVTVHSLPSVGVLPASPAFCAGSSVLLTASGGSTYSWSPSLGLSATTGTSVSANPSGTSTYTVTGTDANGCTNTASATVTVHTLPTVGVLPASPSICLGKSVSLTASGGSTYTWGPSLGLSATTGTSVNANPSGTSTYTVTGTDANGCTNTASATVTVNQLPSVGLLPATPTFCAGQSVLLTASGGSTYTWGPSLGLSATTGTSVNANPSGTSTYTVTGTDANGCTNTASATVTVNQLPSIGLLPASPAFCIGQSVSLTASGGSTYSWSPSLGLSATTGTSVNANPSGTSTYTVTGTDANGCTNTASTTVTVNQLPSVGLLPATPSLCAGKSVSLTASGGSTYSWSPSLGLSATTGTSVNANPSGTSTYTVTGTDANGCTNTANATVTVNQLPSVGLLPAIPSLCAGQSVSLNASGGSTYSWSPSLGLSATTGTSVNANPSGTSTYTVTGTDGNGCTNTASATVTVNQLPSVGLLPATPSLCAGKSVSLTASGGSTYSWSPSLGLSATTGTSVNANPSGTSTYTVTGTDANGCTNTASATVTVNQLPSVGLLPATPSLCAGKSVSLTASGGSTYSWSPSLGLSATTGTSVNANPSGTSTYTVTGTDGNGCTNTASATVTVNQLPSVGLLPATPAICAGLSVSLTASGASTYTWVPSLGLSATTGTSVNANPSGTSTYTVTGTDGNGCTNTASATVTVNQLPSVGLLPATPSLCAGKSVSLTASGGSTYSWSPSLGLSATTGTSVDANPSSTSTYTVTGTDGNGCTNTASATVTVNQLPSVGLLPASPALCVGQSVSLTASGGSTYSWSPSTGLSATTGTSVNANPSGTSTYTVSGTDGNGCTNTASTTVTVNALPTVGLLPATPSLCAGQSVSLNASGGSTYSWSPSLGLSATTGTSVSANPSGTSTYTVTGTDANGCTNTASATVTVNQLPVISINPLSPIICNGQSVLLTAGGANTYSWSPSLGLSATTGTSVTANPSVTSPYTVTGTDANGCSNTAGITVTVNTALVITVTPPIPVICNGQSTSLTAGGANTFTWSPSPGLSSTSGSIVTANPTSTTTYKVIGTAGSCSDSTTVTVTVNSLPSVGILPASPAICTGQSVSLTASGGSTYSWSPSSGLSAITGSSVNANPSGTASYIVTGTDANGCTNTSSITVTVNPLPSIGVLPASPAICLGKSVSLTASGASTYSWGPSSGLSATTGTSVNANPSGTSSYIVTGTDANGCTNTSSVTVTVNPLPSVGVLPASPAICVGQSVSLTASGGSTYSWSPSLGLSATTGTSVNANPSGTSSYIVTGTDANGCSNTANLTVTVNSLPSIGVLPASPAICLGKSVSLTASGGSTYSWSPSLGLSATTGTSVNANPTGNSTYTVTGTDANGCSNTASTTITVNQLPSIGVLPATPAICVGKSVSLTASGGSTYSWSPAGAGLSATNGTSVNANPSGTSSYIVTGTDANGCTNTSSVTVTVNPLPSVGVLPASPAICAGQSVSLTASGGSIYTWSPSLGLSATTGASVNANPTGTSSYIVTGTDVNGCTNTASATVTVNLLPSVGVLPASPAICAGQSVSLTASGGSTYSWSPSLGLSATTGTSVNANPSGTSSYTVTGTDANGCSNTSSATVTVNQLPVISVNPPTPIICNGQSVSLTASGANTYSWSPSLGLSATSGTTVTANPAGTSSYIVTGTDGNGCSNTSDITVTVKSSIVIMVTPPAPVICNGQSASLNAGGANSYTWSPATGLSSLTGAIVGASPTSTTTYKVIGTAGGCSDSTTVTVTVNQLPSVGLLPVSAVLCNGQSVSLTASGGSTGYSWSPSTGLSATSGTSVNANPSGTSTYIVTGTDANGCTNTASATVTVNQLPSIGILPESNKLCLGQSVSLTGSGGSTYSWSPSSGLSSSTGTSVNADPDSTSTYIVTGTDGNGCTNTSSVTLTVNPLPSVGVLPLSSALCAGQSVSLTASGGSTYSWSPSAGLSASTGTSVNATPLVTASYTVTGTDVNGCTNTASTSVTVNQLPVINAGPDISVCPHDSTQLSISGDPGGSTYLWTPATGLSCSTCRNPEVVPLSSNTYTVVVTDPFGCIGDDSVQVNVASFSVTAGTDTSICFGSFIQLEATGGTSYQWSPGTGLSDSTAADPTVSAFSTTTYTVTITSGSCSATPVVAITVYPQPPTPTITQSGDTLRCSTDSSYAFYQWYYNNLPITGATNLYYVASQSGNYNVAVTDVNGCAISVGTNIIITGFNQNQFSYHPIYLFPDPANDYVFVHAPAFHANQGAVVSLLNVLSQRMLVQTVDQDWNGSIDIKSLPAGIYFVQIVNENERWVGRFVKE